MKSFSSHQAVRPAPDEAALKDAYIGERLSLKGVGERFGISVSRVQTLLDRAGIPRRSLQDVHSTSKTRTITKEQLETLYFGRQLGIRKIAEQLGTSKRLIESLFESYDIKRRSSAEANRINAGLSTEVQLTEEFLRRKYEVEKLSLEEIRRQYGFTTKTLRRAFDKFGIARRLHEDACLLVQKGRSLYAATPEQLRELYVQERFSCLAIAKIFNSSERTTRIRLVRAGITIRSVAEAAEAREAQRGNPRALGVVTNKQIREQYEVSCQSMDSIAKTLNISRGAVARCLDTMGLKRRKVADYALISKPGLKDLTKEFLAEEYQDKGRSVHSIATQFGASDGFVVSRLEQFGFAVRSLGEQRAIDRLASKGNYALRVANTLNWDEIRHLYEIDRLGTVKIAERFGVSDQTISRGLERIGVEVRREHTVSTPGLERLTREFLDQEYVSNQRGVYSIAKQVGVASHVVKNRLEKFEIPVRSAEEQREIDSAKERGVYHRPVSSALDWSLIRSLYEDSQLSILSISKSFKVEFGTISRGLERIGVVLRQGVVPNHANLALLTRELLTQEYSEKQLSVNAIATSLRVSSIAVSKRLESFGIPIRSHDEQCAIDMRERRGRYRLRIAEGIDWEQIKLLHTEKHMTLKDIAELFDLHSTTIASGLRRIGVDIDRRLSRNLNLALLAEPEMRRTYLDEKLSIGSIALLFKVSVTAVRTALTKYGIPLRSRKEQSDIDRASSGGSVFLKAAFSLYHTDSESGKVTGEERVADTSVVDPSASLEEKEHGELLASSLEQLAKSSPISSYVLERVWGLGRDPQSIDDIALALKVDPSRIQHFLDEGMAFVRSRLVS